MSKQRKYPFTAYLVTPSMQVRQVELVRRSPWGFSYHEEIGGKDYHEDNLFDDPQAAIAAGRALLDVQRARLAKQQANIEKRAANLDKAAAKF